MKIAVLGGGPAGLYFSSLWKRRHPDSAVTLYEQNPAGATWGFGVVFSDRAMEFLHGDDPETSALITPHLQTWRDITLVHRGQSVRIDGVGFSGIGRLELLKLLQNQARAVGVDTVFDRRIDSLDALGEADLIVGADGLNSLVRRGFEGDFGVSLSYLDNKFVWYGTTQPFETLTQTFVATETGTFNAHHYRYQPGMSTFIVECDRETWLRTGFDAMDEDESRRTCEAIFAPTLGGRPLISNRSFWRNFPRLWCERWHFRNMALVGDALHTAHFSIGSGTRLAMEDVVALVKGLEAHPGDVPAGLAAYEAARKPVVEKLVRAANTSSDWYERFPDHMALDAYRFAMSYITRSGRVDRDRLRAMAPDFVAAFEAATGA